jgi:hypothetical protein
MIPGGFADKTKDVRNDSYSPISDLDKENYELCKSNLKTSGLRIELKL